MIVKVIFVQRKESYPGEYAPEAMESMDEYGYEENPDYLDEKLAAHQKDPMIESAVIINIAVDGREIADRLRPQAKPVQGVIDGPSK